VLIRNLVWLVLVFCFGWLLRRLVRGAIGRTTPSTRSRTPERKDEILVRDRVCNTYLPRSRALSLEVDNERHFFCSERCRSSFLSGARAASGT